MNNPSSINKLKLLLVDIPMVEMRTVNEIVLYAKVLEFEISAFSTNDNNVDPDGVFADVLAFTTSDQAKQALTVVTIAIGLLAVAGCIKVGNIPGAIATAKSYFGAAGYVRT